MNTTYGYCRVSTAKQSIQRQVDNILASFPDAVIMKEACTGTTFNRPTWNKLMTAVKDGDTIVFDEVSRMGRNADEAMTFYNDLYGRGIRLVFLKEQHINTDVFKDTLQIAAVGNDIADVYIEATNKVLLMLAEKQIRIAFETAQHEVDFLHKRTAEGMKAAGAVNVKDADGNTIEQGSISKARTGKTYETEKARRCKAMIAKSSKAFGGNLNDKELIELLNLDRHTYYKYKKQLQSEQI